MLESITHISGMLDAVRAFEPARAHIDADEASDRSKSRPSRPSRQKILFVTPEK